MSTHIKKSLQRILSHAFTIFSCVTIIVLGMGAVAYATTIGANISTGGTLTVSSGTTLATTTISGGDLIVDTDTLFIDSTNNRVGIGTTSPSALLSVNAPAGYPSFMIGSSTATSLIVDNKGNVGIGTASLDAKLKVKQSLTNSTNTGVLNDYTAQSTSNGTYYNTANSISALPFVSSGVSNSGYMTGDEIYVLRNYSSIADSGTLASLVGIGLSFGNFNSDATAAPITTHATGIYIAPYTRTGNINTLYSIYIAGKSGTVVPTNYYGIYQEEGSAKNYFSGNVGIATTTPGGKLSVENTGTGLGFVVSDQANDTTPFVIDANGNVGIGIISPTAKLHLPACTASANTASLKIDPGVVATTPVSGNIESDGTHLYWTDSGGTRRQLDN